MNEEPDPADKNSTQELSFNEALELKARPMLQGANARGAALCLDGQPAQAGCTGRPPMPSDSKSAETAPKQQLQYQSNLGIGLSACRIWWHVVYGGSVAHEPWCKLALPTALHVCMAPGIWPTNIKVLPSGETHVHALQGQNLVQKQPAKLASLLQ